MADPSGGSDTVAITGINPALFGPAVHVSVQSIGWTGYDGAAYTPIDDAETNYSVRGGTVNVPLGALNPSAAYQLIVTPAGSASVPAVSPPATQQYLAANAVPLTDATVYGRARCPTRTVLHRGRPGRRLDRPG